MAKVVFIFSNSVSYQEDRILSFDEGETFHRLGRCHSYESASSCNGLFPSDLRTVSYHHAYVCYEFDQFYIEDISLNGTYVNGYKLKEDEKHILEPGDVVQLSQETFTSESNFFIPTFFVKLFKSYEDFKCFNSLRRLYDCPIQLYRSPPDFEFSLELLLSCVRERFQVLQFLDGVENINLNYKEKALSFLKFVREKNLSFILKLVTGTSNSYEEEYNLQRLDHVSHYIVSISCCQNYVLKKWFMEQEKKLLQIRWYFLSIDEKRKVISTNFSHFSKLNEEYMDADYLDKNVDYYKIAFTEVSELLRTRNVYIRDGFCFVPLMDVITAVITDVIKTIKRNLWFMHKNLHKIWHDERITSIITYIKKEIQFERFLFDNRSSSIVLADLDKLARESFPLCMSVLHYNLKKHHHLRNGGRLQYGLFLKGIGLSLQDSLTFWRYYFTKKMPLNEFIKNYQYHIYHAYGAVGKMADYPPQSCKTVLKAVPAFGEYHGCPFKLLKNEEMTSILKGIIEDEKGMEDILVHMKNGNPQLACKKYFELRHGVTINEIPCHPNRYFEDSLKIRKGSSCGECSHSSRKGYDW